MRKFYIFTFLIALVSITLISFCFKTNSDSYISFYNKRLSSFKTNQEQLLKVIEENDLSSIDGKQQIAKQIGESRNEMKGLDFWFRYLEPIMYKKVNGPLPVEWETEVFEKFEKPYKREGAGLTLAALYLKSDDLQKDKLIGLVKSSIAAMETFSADSITSQLQTYQHFFLCNRLYLLNLAAIYTTGFECPDTTRVIPELLNMLNNTSEVYKSYNENFNTKPLSDEYLNLYKRTILFVQSQPSAFSEFDTYTFIKNYVNPLFALNQLQIKQYRVFSKSFVDYSLNKVSTSIFSKNLYNGQNAKGIFLRLEDSAVLSNIDRIGKLLFYDPILSANNLRSCNSCHKATEYFTDTTFATSQQYNKKVRLSRNAPTLINATFNHLVMLDGKHISLQDQVVDVVTNMHEMGNSNGNEVVKRILSCKEYKDAFTNFLKYTPQETEITIEHVASAITYYYSKFSNYYSPFDFAMNDDKEIAYDVQKGFNLFMSKAQCGTCHFVPHFNGIKPPYVSSEFEVIGVPADKHYSKLSSDKGRYAINNASETMNAIRTGSIRNTQFTKPYMHNGVFTTVDEVIDFYNNGGGAGHGLHVPNQTLSSDSLKLSQKEKSQLLVFISSLNENITFEKPPISLPTSRNTYLNKRKIGGVY